MAIIGNCVQPDVDFPTQTYVEPLLRSNEFPIPPITWGVCLGTEEWMEAIEGLMSPYYILGGPLHPEGRYLEPTLGQIWPRIG